MPTYKIRPPLDFNNQVLSNVSPGGQNGEVAIYQQLSLNQSVQIQHSDLTAAATSEEINLGNALPAGAWVEEVYWEITTAFSGGSSTSATVTVGVSGDNDAFVGPAVSVFTGATTGEKVKPSAGAWKDGDGAQLLANFASDVNVADLDAGDMTFYIRYHID